ncbi:Cd(II)/Pb(II)-responsive transcriptional regulator [Sodalis sp. dw_96]|uniref:Cd(II)/Pb(II)-responsive transcriptional regulator n=1 Tax=Sodalis sp. dw_96 TaxID=2719794 RepID=UPI001BD21634|nr:Cd(II)/Pb(II)-responsive transcriptional regulator [Sodalis sp. dw_96]
MLIGELAKRTGCDTATIRFYERERLLPKPARTDGGYRTYSMEHDARLRFVLRCRSLGMRLDEIRQLQDLQTHPDRACSDIDLLLERHITAVRERINALAELEIKLHELRRCCGQKTSVGECGILLALSLPLIE